MVAADFNGDKKLDLAVVDNTASSVSILMNNSTTLSISFSPASAISAGLGLTPTSIIAADFNGDKKLDLAVGSAGSRVVTVMLGTSTGTFGPPVNTPFRDSIYSVAAADSGPQGIVSGDFNGDGKLDLAVANVGSVSVLVNNAGTFSTRKDYTLSGQPTRIATASLRNTGVLDLVVTLPIAKKVAVLLGNNNGTFATPVTYSSNGGVGLAIADFNADGRLDVAVATAGPSVSILLGNGNGTFGPALSYHVGSGSSPQSWDIAAVDVNSDGFADFVTVDYGNATYGVYLNTPVAALRPAKMNFGTLLLGSTSAAQTATIYNSGIATLKPKITLSGDYSQTSNTCATSLISGANCSVSVAFSPKDINTRAGALSFADNATVTPQKVSLTGVGSEVGVSPNPVPFGPIVHGTTATKLVTITNFSGGSFPAHTLTFTGIAVSGTGFSLVSNACPPSTSSLDAGASCQVTVKFAPSTVGSFSGLLTLTDNGGGSPQKIALTGSGT